LNALFAAGRNAVNGSQAGVANAAPDRRAVERAIDR
jgi:hypothetical protein